MPRLERSQRLVVAYTSFVALSSLLVSSGIISSPSEQANSILFGLSAPRLAMVAGLFFIFACCAVLMAKAVRERAWSEQFLETWFGGKDVSRRLAWFSGISFGLGWIGCFLPGYRVGVLENYWVRVQPGMVFVLLASLATLTMFFVMQNKPAVRDLRLARLKLGLPLFLLFLLVLGGMFYSGFGVVSSEDFWYGAGVPILVSQLIAAIMGGIIFQRFESGWQSKKTQVLICFLIYALTAFLWAREPLNRSFLFAQPADPNYAFYPFADASTFDVASQFPLIGEHFRIFNSVFFERPLYLSFLVYLHSLFGQNYETLMAAQAATFAILPVLIYLIGRSLNIRSVGFGAAIITMLRGINSIAASNMIDMANPKMILTDFPAALGVALVVLCLCEWQKEPERNQHYLAWAGGAIGFTLMLRTNALLLLVFVPLYIFFRLSKEWKQWLVGSCLIFLGVVMVTLPWELRNLSLGGQLYGPIVTKFQNVIKQRYQPTSSLPQGQGLVTLGIAQPVAVLAGGAGAIQDDQACDGVVCFASKHFLHNIITSILILPTAPVLDDLSHLIKEQNPHYWQAEWDGSFKGTAPLFLILNLFFIAAGIVLAWQEKHLAGLTPLAIFIAYHISNALARTSGGRYIVPVDWIVVLYYLLGVFFVITWASDGLGKNTDIFSAAPQTGPKTTSNISVLLAAFIILLGFGGLIPLSEKLHASRYQNFDALEMLAGKQLLIEKAGLKFDELEEFLQNPEANALIGRILYPRSYKMDRGELFFQPFVAMGFPRTAFKLIGPLGEFPVVLPGDVPGYFPHASDALVLGCSGQNYFDALFVIVLGEQDVIYTRKPVSALQCPLQQPVCDNNSVCQ